MHTSPLQPPGIGSFAYWRFELFFKNEEQLVDATKFMSQHRITRMNLTNKKKGDDLLGWIASLEKAGLHTDVCVHWSIKQNYQGAATETHALLKEFCEKITATTGHSKNAVLLVEEQQREAERLQEKLRSGLVRGVWLQMGSDVKRLKEALCFIDAAVAEACWDHSPQVYGSIFVPTRQSLAQMRFRPWSGVYLSDDYLNSVEGAEKITHSILKVYYEAGVVPLVESKITTIAELRNAESMLEAATDAAKGSLTAMRH